MVTGGLTSNVSTFSNSTFINTSSDAMPNYVVTSHSRKPRSTVDKVFNYSVYKMADYKKFMILSPDDIQDDLYLGYTKQFYKKLWITGIHYNKNTDEYFEIIPREQECRLLTSDNSNYTKMEFCENRCPIKIKDCDFNSKKIKKCFSKEEADKQFIFLRKEYLQRMKKDRYKIDDFMNQISSYNP